MAAILDLLQCINNEYRNSAVALFAGQRTCDWQVAVSSPCRYHCVVALGKLLTIHRVPLLPSSRIWYRPRVVISLALKPWWKVMAAYHWV